MNMYYHNKIWYKIYHNIRYDIPRFFKNVYNFKKELYEFRPYDWSYPMGLLRKGLELESKYVEKYGYEVDESRLKKVAKMNRAIELIKMHEDSSFIEMAEEQLGFELSSNNFKFVEVDPNELDPDITLGDKYYEIKTEDNETERENNQRIFELSIQLEQETWNELFEILKGQNPNQITNWETDFDGSGLNTWWD